MSNRLKFMGNRLVTVDKYHQERIKQDWRRLKSSLCLYSGYKLRFILKWCKSIVDYANLVKRRRDKEFALKVKHWRAKGIIIAAPDTVEAFKSHADGEMYTSKAAYRHDLKGRGFEEVGNDKQEPTELSKYHANLAKENDIIQDIKEAINGRRD